MTKTENLNLPQWVAEDPFQREDFNEAFATIDEGYNTAVTDAATARGLAEVAYSPDNKPYTVGSYTGTGESVTVELGFQPVFLIISGTGSSYYSYVNYYGFQVLTGGVQCSGAVQITESGFTVTPQTETDYYPDLVRANRTYTYIAFR